MRVSGGSYRDMYSEAKQMSTKEYSTMREIHSFASDKLSDLIKNKRLIDQEMEQETKINFINMSPPKESEASPIRKVESQDEKII